MQQQYPDLHYSKQVIVIYYRISTTHSYLYGKRIDILGYHVIKIVFSPPTDVCSLSHRLGVN